MRILVTGGMGFIGHHVLNRLMRDGHEPVVFDRRGRVLSNVDIAVEVHVGDIRDYGSVLESMAGCDAFIHLAGVLGTQETIEDPWPAAETNIRGALNVYQAARRHGVRGVNIAVGNHWMNNPYSISKSTAERFALMFNAEHGTKIAVVRALNAYGPRQKDKPVRKIMPNIILPALRGETVRIYGDGEQVMDMIWVGDVAEILIKAATTAPPKVLDRVLEAGTGRPTTVNEIVKMVEDDLGYSVNREYVPMRPGEPFRSEVLGDPKTLAPIGVHPEQLIRLEDGIHRTVESYRHMLDRVNR